jgi:hypothetical protein
VVGLFSVHSSFETPPPAAAGHNQKLFFAHGLSLIQRSRRASAASGEKVKKTLCTFPASSGWSYFCPFCQGHAKGVRCAKGQVLKALLEGRLDATGVELEGAGVELNVLEAQLRLRLLLVRDDAVMSPDEHWPVACRGVDEGAILGLLRCTTRTHSEEAQVLNLDLTARVAEVEGVRIGLRLVVRSLASCRNSLRVRPWKIGRGDVERMSAVAAAIASNCLRNEGLVLGHLGDALLILLTRSLLHSLVLDRVVDRVADRVVDRIADGIGSLVCLPAGSRDVPGGWWPLR